MKILTKAARTVFKAVEGHGTTTISTWRSGKLGPWGQIQHANFCELQIRTKQSHPLIYILSVALFAGQQQSGAIASDHFICKVCTA